ncbi:sulfatase family protein [Brachybacterium sp. 107]|uniref:sulfatase family protein n=1 Tax=Brachybacterium sp. 107 TaxID=3457736 RepID=UPI0040339FC4
MARHHHSSPQEDRPNIVLILTDDHAAHAVSAYGSAVNSTPRIDEIAETGALLENCFCTNSICAPSRASILTGTYSHVHGVTTLKTPIDAGQPTFITQLRDAGYRTAIFGKWHLGHGEGHDPEGFDQWEVLIDQGRYVDPEFLTVDGMITRPGYATDVITTQALNWVESLESEAPWCVLIHHKAPHRSWFPDEAHAGMYADPIPVPETLFDGKNDWPTRSEAARHQAMTIADHLYPVDLKVDPPEHLSGDELTLWKYQRYMEDYLACIASVDDNVGRVTDWLRERGDFENTLLMYTSDQGFFLGDHGWYDKRFMYDESIRMPFVLSLPRQIEAGQRHAGIVTNVDIAQSVLEAVGVASHPRMQGRSFWRDITQGTPEPSPDGFYYRYYENDDPIHHAFAHYGYRTDRYKLIYFYNDGLGLPGSGTETFTPEWEMYDLLTDREEVHNVAHDPEYRDVRADLEVRMWRSQRALGDTPHPSQPVPAGLAHDERGE